MKEFEFCRIEKKEVTIKEDKTEIGKIIIDTDNKILIIISSCFSLGDLQNFFFDLISQTNEFFSMPIAGDMLIPGAWEIRIKSEDSHK